MIERFKQEKKEFAAYEVVDMLLEYAEQFNTLDQVYQSIDVDSDIYYSSNIHPKFNLVEGFLRSLHGKISAFRTQSVVSNFELNLIIGMQNQLVHKLQVEYGKVVKGSVGVSKKRTIEIGRTMVEPIEQAFTIIKPFVQPQKKYNFNPEQAFYPMLATRFNVDQISQL
jgi:hypothetical protein